MKCRACRRVQKCAKCGTKMVCFCPACRGRKRSPRKAFNSRLNGLKGGRKRNPFSKSNMAVLNKLAKLDTPITIQALAKSRHKANSAMWTLVKGLKKDGLVNLRMKRVKNRLQGVTELSKKGLAATSRPSSR